jgi:metallophosphoesterase superfamily enzyme
MTMAQSLDRRWLARKIDKNKILFISDLHLGFEIEWVGRGLKTSIPNWSIEILNNLREEIIELKPSHLIICGDFEHHFSLRQKGKENLSIAIPDSMRERILQTFNSKILSIPDLEIIFVCGEHDIFLYHEFKNKCKIVSSSGTHLFNNQIGVFHGDKQPFKEIVFSSEIFLGHVHPTITLKDDLQVRHKLPVFAKLILPREDSFSLFNFPFELEEVGMIDSLPINILPAYNPYIPGYLLNKIDGGRKLHKGYPAISQILRHPDLQIQMTDGIDLGLLTDL